VSVAALIGAQRADHQVPMTTPDGRAPGVLRRAPAPRAPRLLRRSGLEI